MVPSASATHSGLERPHSTGSRTCSEASPRTEVGRHPVAAHHSWGHTQPQKLLTTAKESPIIHPAGETDAGSNPPGIAGWGLAERLEQGWPFETLPAPL